jgi:hypothetical protein
MVPAGRIIMGTEKASF